jgi:hypothetical protein
MPRTNIVMFNNLPVLHKKTTFYNKSASAVKALTFEDVYRCLDKNEAKVMLNDPYGENELRKLLSKYFNGNINKV